MIDFIKFHRYLRSARSRKRGFERQYDEEIREAMENGKPQDDINSIIIDKDVSVTREDHFIRSLVSNRMVDLAEKYLLPVPEYKKEDAGWEVSVLGFGYILKPEALNALRDAVRKERKERAEHFIMWAAPVTGLIGALTGLVAVILAN